MVARSVRNVVERSAARSEEKRAVAECAQLAQLERTVQRYDAGRMRMMADWCEQRRLVIESLGVKQTPPL